MSLEPERLKREMTSDPDRLQQEPGPEPERLKREIYRYLGFGRQLPDSAVQERVEACLEELQPQLTLREVHRYFPLEWESGKGDFTGTAGKPEAAADRPSGAADRPSTASSGTPGILRIEGMDIQSGALEKNLRGCSEVCLMAATIGFAPDRLAARASAAGQVSRAVMIQAAGAALIEAWCDQVNGIIRQEAAARGKYLRPRFSPGYGDFSLQHQEALFRILDVQKRIGVTLTEHLLMMPSKSVTALIGLSETDERCAPAGCESCERAESCTFRRF